MWVASGDGWGSVPGEGSSLTTVETSPPIGNSSAGEEPPLPPSPSPLVVIGSASFCAKALRINRDVGNTVVPISIANAPPRAEPGLMSASVASRNPTTSRTPMAAAIRAGTSSRNECTVRSVH